MSDASIRTTLSLYPEIAIQITNFRENQNLSFKEAVNKLLSMGLDCFHSKKNNYRKYKLKTFNTGQCKFETLDNVSEILAITEGDNYK